VRKTSLYLDEEDVERLKRLAARKGSSQAEVVRLALAAYEQQVLDRNFALAGSWEGSGASVADALEEELLQGFGED
jgi:hypothetical protein